MVKMKIEGPNRAAPTGKSDKTKKTGSTTGPAFSEYLTENDVEASAAPTSVGGVTMFTALQAAEQATEQEERRRAIVHADDLLSDLEDLRVGLILGTYTQNQLFALASRLQKQRPNIRDPQLLELLEEIEIRAAVELAKYES
jgi:hypothetical protein